MESLTGPVFNSMGVVPISPGGSPQPQRRTGPGGGIDNEDIRVHTIPIQEVDDWLQKQGQTGKLLDPKIFSALHWISRSQLNT